MYTIAMTASFEAEKNRKALIYTVIICGTLLLLAFLISWTHTHTQPLITEDLIEINLGDSEASERELKALIAAAGIG